MSELTKRLPIRYPVLVAGAACLVVLLILFGSGQPRAQVPRASGQPLQRALKRIANHDLEARVIRSAAAARRLRPSLAGRVVEQSYPAGTTIPRGSVVRVWVAPRGGTTSR